MRNIIIALLILGLVAPALTVGANHPNDQVTRYHDAHYAAGGSGFATSVEPARDLPGEGSIRAVYSGDIIVPLTDPDPEDDYLGGVEHVETVIVNFTDFVAPHVAVYYSFHASDDIETSLFGGPHEALETGVFCDDAELDRPLDPLATHLRLSVNTASALDANVCPFGGVATAGTWQAKHPGANPDPKDDRPWSPPPP